MSMDAGSKPPDDFLSRIPRPPEQETKSDKETEKTKKSQEGTLSTGKKVSKETETQVNIPTPKNIPPTSQESQTKDRKISQHLPAPNRPPPPPPLSPKTQQKAPTQALTPPPPSRPPPPPPTSPSVSTRRGSSPSPKRPPPPPPTQQVTDLGVPPPMLSQMIGKDSLPPLSVPTNVNQEEEVKRHLTRQRSYTMEGEVQTSAKESPKPEAPKRAPPPPPMTAQIKKLDTPEQRLEKIFKESAILRKEIRKLNPKENMPLNDAKKVFAILDKIYDLDELFNKEVENLKSELPLDLKKERENYVIKTANITEVLEPLGLEDDQLNEVFMPIQTAWTATKGASVYPFGLDQIDDCAAMVANLKKCKQQIQYLKNFDFNSPILKPFQDKFNSLSVERVLDILENNLSMLNLQKVSQKELTSHYLHQEYVKLLEWCNENAPYIETSETEEALNLLLSYTNTALQDVKPIDASILASVQRLENPSVDPYDLPPTIYEQFREKINQMKYKIEFKLFTLKLEKAEKELNDKINQEKQDQMRHQHYEKLIEVCQQNIVDRLSTSSAQDPKKLESLYTYLDEIHNENVNTEDRVILFKIMRDQNPHINENELPPTMYDNFHDLCGKLSEAILKRITDLQKEK